MTAFTRANALSEITSGMSLTYTVLSRVSADPAAEVAARAPTFVPGRPNAAQRA
jgi:hypothetical protein